MKKVYALLSTALFAAVAASGQVNNTAHSNNQASIHSNEPGTCDGSCPSFVRNGNGSLGQVYNVSKCGLNYVQASQRLKKRGSYGWGVNQPAPYVISGIPLNACIEAAYVWSSMSGTAITHNVTITNPNNVTMSFPMMLIGSGADKCWGYGASTAYRADVTAVITGNGTYMLSGLPTNPPTPYKDTDGATLFIIYSDPAATYEGHLVIHDGSVVGIGGNTAQTMTAINACANSTYGRAFCMTGDWQLTCPTGTWNGSFINISPNWWNYDEVATNVTNGQATALYSHSGCNDCYQWVVMGLYYQTTTCTTCPNNNNLVLTTTTVDAVCGNCNGTATVNASGGQSPYTYQWDANTGNQTTQTATGLCAGTYTVTVTDNSPCPLVSVITVTINSSPALTLSQNTTNVLCNGNCNGDATANVSGGASPFTYSWSNGQTTQTATGLCAGTYTVTVTDINGCTDTMTVTITEPSALVATISSSSDVLCNGGNDGQASVTASGGTTAYSYAWSSGGTGTTETGLGAGVYTVTVTDNNGCTQTATVTINEPPALLVNISGSSDVLCNGGNDGQASVTASGGTTPYAYAWSSGGTASTETGLSAGTYTVTVTDNNGCTQTTTVTINEPTQLTATISNSSNVLCNGGNDGQATVTASGGTTAYSYTWSSGGTGTTETGLSAGVYTVTVTDNNGCTQVASVTITEPTLLTSSVTNSTNILCNGDSTGDATVTASGGTTAYTYSWSSGGTSPTETGLGAGTYTVTVTDNNGCTSVASVTLTEPPAIVLSASSLPSHCGQADGESSVAASGGVSSFTYAWSSGCTASNCTGLLAGTYTVTVTDGNGCTEVATVNISDLGGGTATATLDLDVTCNGGCDGQASVSMNGGNPPFSYNWSNGGTNATATGLCAGTYTVTVTDSVGCVSVDTAVVSEPPLLTASISGFNDALCNGSSDGDATVSATGGTPGYNYAWSSGGTALLETGLPAGTYTVTVTDNNGCTATTTVTIGEPTPVVAAISGFNDALCYNAGDGDATASASGGTSPYTYQWDANAGNQTTQNASGLSAGTYAVTVTDNNGCTSTITVTIAEPAPIAISFTSNDISCNGYCDGFVIVNVNGGTQPYNYTWTPTPGSGQGTPTPSNMCATTYTLNITDAHACSFDTVFVLNEPAPISPNAIPKDVTCPGDCDGIVDLSVLGGATPYAYHWGNGETTEDIFDLCIGIYHVTVTDANGCTVSANSAVNLGNDNPLADFYADPDETNLRNTRIQFYDDSEGDIDQWNWTFYDVDGQTILGGSNEKNPEFLFPDQDTGTYCIHLEVVSPSGCADDTTKCIHIEGLYDIYIPNAFTPNGDGINDYFFPKGIGINENDFTFYVFDRWGEIIFESHKLSDKWDGIAHAKGGTKMVQDGVYVWLIITTDEVEHLEHEYIGHVSVIR